VFVITDAHHESDDGGVPVPIARFEERQLTKISAITIASLPFLVTARLAVLQLTPPVIIFIKLTQNQY
jgi:hypothetical protein